MAIGIIGAMEEEIEWLYGQMEKVHREDAAGGVYYSGTLEGRDIVLVRSGVGKVNAAIAAALLIERYRPELILCTGTAGGIGSGQRIGDVVVGVELAYSDVEATAFSRYVYGQVPRMPARYAAPEEHVNLARIIAGGQTENRVAFGLITTADSFIGRQEAADFIRGRFPESLATDMESAAFAQTAYNFGVPFLAIRSVSDIAGSEAGGLFAANLELAALNSARFVREWVKQYEPVLPGA